MSVDSAIKAAGLRTRRSWFTYENGTSMMPPERWKKVLEAVEHGGYETSARPVTKPDLHVERRVSHALRRLTAEELGQVRESYVELAKRLGLSMRELAKRAGGNAMNISGLFEANTPREATYRAIMEAMAARKRELTALVGRIDPTQQVSGAELAAVRNALGLSQNEFARLLGHKGKRVGVMVSEYERGVRAVALERTARLKGEMEQQLDAAEDPALWARVFGPLEESPGASQPDS
jgi:transcriptional regulator with XRE-family HTH domain